MAIIKEQHSMEKSNTENYERTNKYKQQYEFESAIGLAIYKEDSKKGLRKQDAKYREDMGNVITSFTRAICCALEYRDSYTAGHQERVANLALLVGKQFNCSEDQLKELYIGGMLHDIGKIGVPLNILSKSTPLNKMEFMLLKDHVKIGYDILKGVSFPWNIKDIILNHHEALDGSGYPNGLRGDKISKAIRVITVCDVVEAMSTMRPYRIARTRNEVLEELKTGKAIKYDEEIANVMIDLIETKVYNPWKDSIIHSDVCEV